ncbi:glycoside hydrolase family 31 protein [Cohnella terricola]|uniref:Glycoside hydrolase family 31 protein n=1 Tax=Cohnella terricola TaxID=1289167 RepID=A0A559JKJ8_9BACL|nr:TIM-barrel domain-containing protein [Cohnella terricola]TVY00403.1 glycoside hydrolase family 31 protein [Cohnella terricola]
MLTSEAILPDRPDDGNEKETTLYGSIGAILQVEQGEGTVVLRGERASVAFRYVDEHTLRMKLFFGDNPDMRTTPAIMQAAGNGKIEVEERDEHIVLTSGALHAVVNPQRFSLRVFDAEGRLLLEELETAWDTPTNVTFAAAKTNETHFYGLGEKTGFLDKNGERYEMWNSDVFDPHVQDTDALYQSIPFLMRFEYGKPTYGLLLDNPGRTVFDMRSHEDRYTISTHTGELDLYVLGGPGIKDVVRRLTDLTGRSYMPPAWSIGYQQSRYSYMSQEEVLEIARTFRRKQIPCDVLYLDIHYMDEYRVFTWDSKRFPRPKEMMAELKEMGFEVVPIVDPGVKKDPKYPVYAEGVRNGYFCRKLEGDIFIGKVWPGLSAFPDFTEEEVSRWWGDLHRFYIEHGINGIWNDMNEPSVFNESKTMDLDVLHGNGGDPKTHEEWHNLYGFLMSKATFEGMKRGMGGERPFVLTRAGYAGIQRYATVWTGDNRSFWEHMAMSIPMVLNLGMSGIAFAGPDVGGFSHHSSGELVARWTQLGALIPFFRNHSAIDTRRQEPWLFGEQVESICREYIGLRYRLLPYLYSLFYEAHQTGVPIVRSLIMEYPEDRGAYNICDQFLLGSFLLAAPIYRPGVRSRAVYLPEGIWYDYWTGERHEGGRSILADAPLERMPLYVKAGAVIPEAPLRQWTGEASDEPIRVQAYAGADGTSESRFTLFEDDGRSYDFEAGKYRLREFRLTETNGQVRFTCECSHDGLSGGRELSLVFNQAAGEPAGIEISGDAEIGAWTYDSANRQLQVTVRAANSFELTIR